MAFGSCSACSCTGARPRRSNAPSGKSSSPPSGSCWAPSSRSTHHGYSEARPRPRWDPPLRRGTRIEPMYMLGVVLSALFVAFGILLVDTFGLALGAFMWLGCLCVINAAYHTLQRALRD